MYEFSDLVLIVGLLAGLVVVSFVLALAFVVRVAVQLLSPASEQLAAALVVSRDLVDPGKGSQDAPESPQGDAIAPEQAHPMSHPNVAPKVSSAPRKPHPALFGPFPGRGCRFCGQVRAAAARVFRGA